MDKPIVNRFFPVSDPRQSAEMDPTLLSNVADQLEAVNKIDSSEPKVKPQGEEPPAPPPPPDEPPPDEPLEPPALLRSPNILAELDSALDQVGLVGERKIAKLLYLAHTTRLFAHPVSVVVKGASSGGKSFTVKQVLKFIPPEAYLIRTGLTAKALAYGKEPLSHTHLVILEADGISKGQGAYQIRTLLSDGCIVWESVRSSESIVVRREGPTGLITTTTALNIHDENENRVFSVHVSDSPEQTRAILRRIASPKQAEPDFASWHEAQRWLATTVPLPVPVVIPFIPKLAEKFPIEVTRYRRDFEACKWLIEANAFLHQLSRAKDDTGGIVATWDDYEAVREILNDPISAAKALDPKVREVVEVVSEMQKAKGGRPVELHEIMIDLGIDKTTAKRRVDLAILDGWLINETLRRDLPPKLIIGRQLSELTDSLPTRAELEAA